MPAIVTQHGKPSTLADVLRQVSQAFGLMANATPIQIGRQFLKHGIGEAPRVVFVPEGGAGGKIEPSSELGNAAKWIHSCEVHVRAKEGLDDIERFSNAYALADLVIDCLQTAATGRIEFGAVIDGSPTDTNGPGAEIVFSFIYRRDVWHDARRWALSPAGADNSGATPHPPPGVPSGGNTIVPMTTPRAGA